MSESNLLDAEYILPLRWNDDDELPELSRYLRALSTWLAVTVIDGSEPQLFAAHRRVWPPEVRQLSPRPRPGHNGKVVGVMTGVEASTHEMLVIADDDVRYRLEELERLVAILQTAACVMPQNYFSPLPWHARWDTGRTLLNRSLGSDYSGTMAVRRSLLVAAGGYNPDVLFENLELIRTVRAMGGRVVRADDLFVARRPPSARHFFGQRMRQAYDDFAQPARLALELAFLPLIVTASRRPSRMVTAVFAVVALAEFGRRRRSGSRVFPPSSSLWAPLWVAERAVCVWLAVAARATGGVRFGTNRIRTAGSSPRTLRRTLKHARFETEPTREVQTNVG